MPVIFNENALNALNFTAQNSAEILLDYSGISPNPKFNAEQMANKALFFIANSFALGATNFALTSCGIPAATANTLAGPVLGGAVLTGIAGHKLYSWYFNSEVQEEIKDDIKKTKNDNLITKTMPMNK